MTNPRLPHTPKVQFSGGNISAIERQKVLYLSQPEVIATLYKWADEVEPANRPSAITLRAAARSIAGIGP